VSFVGESIQRFGRANRLMAATTTTAMAVGLTLAAVTPASAAPTKTLPAKYAGFAHCPVGVKGVSACLYSSVSSGEFVIGSTTLSFDQPITVSLGLIPQKNGSLKAVAPTDGTPALVAQPIPVSIEGVSGVVTATTTLLQLPSVNIIALETGSGVALSLPLDVQLNDPPDNVLLGNSCTIGDAANPITLNLTTGTTNPPPPNKPISGTPGSGKIDKHSVVTITGTSLVDNAFAVPQAYGCGPLGLLDSVINSAEGLPSAAGNNTVIMNAGSGFAPASLIKKYVG
jgi:hypothetical protein